MDNYLCRLCLGTENLVHVFDKKVSDNMADIIAVASGVEIQRTDQITQMICSTCCQITLKIFKFRNTSIKNDQDLKAKRLDLSVAELLGNVQHTTTNNASLSVSTFLNAPVSNTSKTTVANTTGVSFKQSVVVLDPAVVRKARPLISKKYQKAHLSLRNILRQNPKIDLPEDLPLQAHYGPYITLMSEEVDEWFREKGFTNSEIQDLKEEAVLNNSILFNRLSINMVGDKEINKHIEIQSCEKQKMSSVTVTNVTKKPTQIEACVKQKIPSSIDDSCKKLIQVIKNDHKKLCENVSNTVDGLKRPNLNSLEQESQVSLHKKLKTTKTSSEPIKDQKNVGNKSQILSSVPPTNSGNITDVKPKTERKSLDTNLILDRLSKETVCEKEVITLESMLATSENISHKPKGSLGKVKVNSSLETLMDTNSSALVLTQNDENKSVKAIDNLLETNKQILLDSGKELTIETSLHTNWENASNTDNDSFDMDAECSRMSLSSNCSSFNQIEDAKEKAYFHSLELEPKSSVTENQPDLSLLSLAATKSRQLYSCTICDSYHASLRDLKLHERKQHTKCPFCTLRFCNLETRNNHVKYSCGMNLVNLRTINIPLVRVNEDDIIKNQYPQAFTELEHTKVTSESEIQINLIEDIVDTIQTEITHVGEKSNEANFELQQQQRSLEQLKLVAQTMEKPPPLVESVKIVSITSEEPSKKRKMKDDGFIDHNQLLAMQEIEKYIKQVETITTEDDDESQSKRKRSSQKRSKNKGKARISTASDVIFISDDEHEGASNRNKEVLVTPASTPTSELETTTVVTMETAAATTTETAATTTAATSTDNTNQTNTKQQVSETLHNINTSATTTTTATLTNKTNQRDTRPQVSKTLHNINMLDMVKNVSDDVDVINMVKRILTNRKGGTEPGENQNWEATNPIVDGSSPKVKIFKNLRKHLHNFKIPIVISFSNKICAEYKPVKPAPEVKLADLWTTMVAQDLKRSVIVSVPSSKNLTAKSPLKTVAQHKNVATAAAQNHVATSNSFIITSKPPTIRSVNSQAYTPSLVLNGGTTGSSNYANLILLPSILTTQPNLPTSQGPLPIIQSVTSLDESSTNNVTVNSNNAIPNAIITPNYKVQSVNGQMQLRTDNTIITSKAATITSKATTITSKATTITSKATIITSKASAMTSKASTKTSSVVTLQPSVSTRRNLPPLRVKNFGLF